MTTVEKYIEKVLNRCHGMLWVPFILIFSYFDDAGTHDYDHMRWHQRVHDNTHDYNHMI